MGETLLLASKILFAATGCGAGVRLAQMAWREGGFQLHAWGAAMIFVGGIGLVGFGFGPAVAKSSVEAARWLMLGSDTLQRLSLVALSVFVWRVFGEGRASRTALLGAMVVFLFVTWLMIAFAQRWPDPAVPAAVQLPGQIAFFAPFAWSAAEAWIYYGRAKRRIAIGLADAATCHRFFLWSLGCTTFAAVCLLAALSTLAPDQPVVLELSSTARALLYVAISSIVVLAFFPPAAYERWVAGTPAR